MILPTFSEEQILSELIKDIKIVKRLAKKKADAYLNNVRKSGGFVRETDYESYSVKTVSGNKWNLEIEYDQTKKIPWLYRACCIVESEKKTKDYYLVRGINTEKPYFVKITSHTLKRDKERNKLDKYRIGLETYACWTFEHREIGICMRYIDVKFNMLLQNMNDTEEISDMSYIVLVYRGVYYATRTQQGNYVFKTYISSVMGISEVLKYLNNKSSKWSKEGELLHNMIIVHQYFNKNLYDKEVLNDMLYSAIDRNQKMVLNENSPIILLRN